MSARGCLRMPVIALSLEARPSCGAGRVIFLSRLEGGRVVMRIDHRVIEKISWSGIGSLLISFEVPIRGWVGAGIGLG